MSVEQAIRTAEQLLPGAAAPEGEIDPRWQAILAVGEFALTEPEPVWTFARRWAVVPDDDLRSAVATCLLEHLLEYHFEAFYARMRAAAEADPGFAECVSRCWAFGEAAQEARAAQFAALKVSPSARPARE